MWNTSTYLNSCWGLVGETDDGVADIWWIDDGQDYPHLWWELLPEAF